MIQSLATKEAHRHLITNNATIKIMCPESKSLLMSSFAACTGHEVAVMCPPAKEAAVPC